MVLNKEMEIETLIQFGTQLFEDRLVLNPGSSFTQVSFSFVQTHFLA